MIVAQNGRQITQATKILVNGCHKQKKKKRHMHGTQRKKK